MTTDGDTKQTVTVILTAQRGPVPVGNATREELINAIEHMVADELQRSKQRQNIRPKT